VDADLTLERELREREESHLRYESRSRPQAMADLLAEEFIEFGSSGRIIDRASVIEAASRQATFQFRIDAFAARPLGERVALTTYRLSAWSESETDARGTLRSSIWVHRAGRWPMVFHQERSVAEGVRERLPEAVG
jgi:hypothetical protein